MLVSNNKFLELSQDVHLFLSDDNSQVLQLWSGQGLHWPLTMYSPLVQYEAELQVKKIFPE